jgi:succinate dehydrogenase / fumarate reductase membrane anchor subunit
MSWRAIHWVLQRVTGALLLVLLIAHFWVEHFASENLLGGQLNYQAIEARIRMPAWQAIDLTFLAVALYHGLNGLRNILLDYSRIGPRMARVLTAALIVTGAIWMYWGVEAFKNL